MVRMRSMVNKVGTLFRCCAVRTEFREDVDHIV